MVCRDFILPEFCKPRLFLSSIQFAQLILHYPSAKRHTPPDTCFLPQHWDALQACGAEDWFLESCQKIEYLFPRGHGAAMADCLARLVWYAIHAPKESEAVFKKAAEQNGF